MSLQVHDFSVVNSMSKGEKLTAPEKIPEKN